MISELSIIEIPTNNVKTLVLKDGSSYNPDITVENAVIEVTSPGSLKTYVNKINPGDTIILNSSLLKIVPAKYATQLVALPDGIYQLKYSIKPNRTLFVEYALLRNTVQLQRYFNATCGLISKKCSITLKEYEEKRRRLTWIKELIDSAKWTVEECGDEDKGLELYQEANRLLNDFDKCGCK
jgi:hypothetical protein